LNRRHCADCPFLDDNRDFNKTLVAFFLRPIPPEEYRDQIENWKETVCEIAFGDCASDESEKKLTKRIRYSWGPGDWKRHMDGKIRANIKPGMAVEVVLKKDQRTGALTSGVVKRILTKSANHPHGIKVELESGQVGRVKKIAG